MMSMMRIRDSYRPICWMKITISSTIEANRLNLAVNCRHILHVYWRHSSPASERSQLHLEHLEEWTCMTCSKVHKWSRSDHWQLTSSNQHTNQSQRNDARYAECDWTLWMFKVIIIGYNRRTLQGQCMNMF